MYSVYVIQSIEGLRYIGQTGDLDQRIEAHNARHSKWTSRGTNWTLIYSEEYPTRSEAMKREQWLKTGMGRQFLAKKLDNVGP